MTSIDAMESQFDDIRKVLEAALSEPPETSLRLERIRRSLGEEIKANPQQAAETIVSMERDRCSKQRQITKALELLGERNALTSSLLRALSDLTEVPADDKTEAPAPGWRDGLRSRLPFT